MDGEVCYKGRNKVFGLFGADRGIGGRVADARIEERGCGVPSGDGMERVEEVDGDER